MALRLPPQLLSTVQSFLELPDERIQAFVDALTNAGQNFNTNDLINEVSNRSKLPRGMMQGIIQALVAYYGARETKGLPLESFIDEQIAPAIKAALSETQTVSAKDKA